MSPPCPDSIAIRKRSLITEIFVLSILLSLFLGLTLPQTYASTSTYKFTYTFYVENGWLWEYWEPHTLYVSITQSLYDYYKGRDHSCYSRSDYLKFITPDAVRPIADRIWSICQSQSHSEEQFANAVLMVVHQIPYVVSSPKYPVETIVENSGDCDVFSLLAASIMKAKGMDVVLFDWTDKAHMNIGVYLSETPVYARGGSVWYISYNSKRYYIAECTGYCSGANATSGWRVGECPDDLKQASATIIPLNNVEMSSPAQVSASVDADLSTSYFATLTRSPSPPYYVGQQIQIQGTISPAHVGKNVVLYCRKGTGSWTVLSTTTMDSSGAFSFTFTFSSVGTYYLRASWSGDADHEGADSSILSFDVSLAPSSIYLTLSASTIYIGETVTITGYISPIHSYQTINLYYSIDGEDWLLLTQVDTNIDGYFSYQWAPTLAETFYIKAVWLGDSDHQGATSEVQTIIVNKAMSTLTLLLSSSNINLGNTVILSGEITPIHQCASVDLYVSENGYQWSLLATVITDTQGRYVYQWTPTSTGTYYLKAHWLGDTDHTGDESNISTLQVAYSPTSPDDQGTPNPPSPPTPPDNQGSESYIPTYLPMVLIAALMIGVGLLFIWRKRI
ncbi:MAG: Ig-like domain-containing protein [Candidatus Bathyarchaeia archaeon]